MKRILNWFKSLFKKNSVDKAAESNILDNIESDVVNSMSMLEYYKLYKKQQNDS